MIRWARARPLRGDSSNRCRPPGSLHYTDGSKPTSSGVRRQRDTMAAPFDKCTRRAYQLDRQVAAFNRLSMSNRCTSGGTLDACATRHENKNSTG